MHWHVNNIKHTLRYSYERKHSPRTVIVCCLELFYYFVVAGCCSQSLVETSLHIYITFLIFCLLPCSLLYYVSVVYIIMYYFSYGGSFRVFAAFYNYINMMIWDARRLRKDNRRKKIFSLIFFLSFFILVYLLFVLCLEFILNLSYIGYSYSILYNLYIYVFLYIQ